MARGLVTTRPRVLNAFSQPPEHASVQAYARFLETERILFLLVVCLACFPHLPRVPHRKW